MARIFLSYDRDDEARARPIAAVLEQAGHSVWWDRQIKGGREFAAEIESALEAAERVAHQLMFPDPDDRQTSHLAAYQAGPLYACVTNRPRRH